MNVVSPAVAVRAAAPLFAAGLPVHPGIAGKRAGGSDKPPTPVARAACPIMPKAVQLSGARYAVVSLHYSLVGLKLGSKLELVLSVVKR